MNKVSEVIEVYNCLILLEGVVEHSALASHPKDIDLYVPEKIFDKAITILKDFGYICVSDTNYHVLYAKFENGELFIFDLTKDYNIYLTLCPSLKLSPKGNLDLSVNLQLNKSFKKLVVANKIDRYDIAELKNFFAFKENFLNLPKLKLEDYEDFIGLKKYISREKDRNLFGFRVRLLFKRFNTGKSYAFVGPDGSGKGFFIDKLKKIQPIKTVYMGDWFFSLQIFYSALVRLPSPWNRFLQFFYYFENLIRRLKVSFWTTVGYDVFIDRFPGTNSPVVLNGIPGFINCMIFKLTLKPDLFVLLYARPDVVFKRKQELTIEQIFKIQDGQKKILSKSNHVVIDTENMDISLNFLLRKFYEI